MGCFSGHVDMIRAVEAAHSTVNFPNQLPCLVFIYMDRESEAVVVCLFAEVKPTLLFIR